jgi:hypothetical protein
MPYPGWQKRFGGDPTVVGRTVKFNGQDFTILGITPPGFYGTELYFAPDVFFPMMMQKQLEGGSGYLEKTAAILRRAQRSASSIPGFNIF